MCLSAIFSISNLTHVFSFFETDKSTVKRPKAKPNNVKYSYKAGSLLRLITIIYNGGFSIYEK